MVNWPPATPPPAALNVKPVSYDLVRVKDGILNYRDFTIRTTKISKSFVAYAKYKASDLVDSAMFKQPVGKANYEIATTSQLSELSTLYCFGKIEEEAVEGVVGAINNYYKRIGK